MTVKLKKRYAAMAIGWPTLLKRRYELETAKQVRVSRKFTVG